MKTKRTVVGGTGVILALGLSGCGVEGATEHRPAPNEQGAAPVIASKVEPTSVAPQRWSSPSVNALENQVKHSLESLASLQVFTIDRLMLELPETVTACEGGPCTDDPAGQVAYEAELGRQAERLARLEAQAKRCATSNCYAFFPDSAEHALRAINALEIIAVPSIVEVKPQNNPACYNLPCDSDVAAAKEQNRNNVIVTFSAAVYTKLEEDRE